MQKAFLIVELTDEKDGQVVYAIQYTGVMTRRNIYAKLTQYTGSPKPKYIKVAKQDTIDCTKDWDSVFSGVIYRHIKVNCNVGMDDDRIQKVEEKSLPSEILKEIHRHVHENKELVATL